MEQFDTDDKLIENSKDKKDKSSNTRYLLIGICCLVVIGAIILLFKYLNPSSSAILESGKYFFIIFQL